MDEGCLFEGIWMQNLKAYLELLLLLDMPVASTSREVGVQ
jgi:hypothetical protein